MLLLDQTVYICEFFFQENTSEFAVLPASVLPEVSDLTQRCQRIIEDQALLLQEMQNICSYYVQQHSLFDNKCSEVGSGTGMHSLLVSKLIHIEKKYSKAVAFFRQYCHSLPSLNFKYTDGCEPVSLDNIFEGDYFDTNSEYNSDSDSDDDEI